MSIATIRFSDMSQYSNMKRKIEKKSFQFIE